MKTFNFPLLTADQIEVKVKQVSAKGAVLLLYKTARTDRDILDEIVGPMKWQDDYKEIKGNLYCGIGILDEDRNEWIWKWDCGIESRADDDGNEKKGEASDAFKRAGFCWGIGRELYTSPFTFAKVETEKNDRGRYELKDKFMRFKVAEIDYENRKVSRLVITDNRGQVVFSFGKGAMPVGSAEAAQEAGNKKLDEINAKLAEAAKPAAKAAQSGFKCERCGNVIKPIKFSDGTVLKVSEILDTSNKDMGGNYCYKCYMELMEARDGGSH